MPTATGRVNSSFLNPLKQSRLGPQDRIQLRDSERKT
jgi:hypothetical protein